jgi:hypothetical protein
VIASKKIGGQSLPNRPKVGSESKVKQSKITFALFI